VRSAACAACILPLAANEVIIVYAECQAYRGVPGDRHASAITPFLGTGTDGTSGSDCVSFARPSVGHPDQC
jgi:hypothetical protein